MRHTFRILSAALLAAAAPSISDQCTTTIGLPGGCCPPDKTHTETSLIDCKGCAITSMTTGIHCMMICPTPALSTVKGTTTVTSCSPSAPMVTRDMSSIPASSSVDGSMGIGNPGFVACTKTITKHEHPRCTYTKPLHTTTKSIDCQCCELTETTISADYAIRCASPVTTIFNNKRTKTETACATSTSCSIYW